MRSLALLAALALAACGHRNQPRPCTAQPVTKGPWVNRVGPTRATIHWEAKQAGCVEVGFDLEGRGTGDSAAGTAKIAKGAATLHAVTSEFKNGLDEPDLAGDYQMAAVELAGLTPGTCYSYWLVDTTGAWRVGRFCTARPAGAPFRFMAIGDTNPALGRTAGILTSVLPRKPDFVVHMGDIQYYSSIIETQVYWFRKMAPMLQEGGGFFPAIGNHEFELKSATFDEWKDYSQRFWYDPSAQLDGLPQWYHFDWGGVTFVAIDTEVPWGAGTEQAIWLEATLAAAKAEPGHRFSVVYMHRCLYTLGDTDPELSQRRDLWPIFEAQGVRLVLQGHMHGYERFMVPAAGGYDIPVITTAGGGATIGDLNQNVPKYPDDVPLRVNYAAKPHAVDFQVGAGTIHGEVIDDTGVLLDSFDIDVPRG